MGCRVGNRSSHRRSFRVRNDLPEWENTDRPVTRSTLCNILAARSGRMGEYGKPVTNPFGGRGVVLAAQLTRGFLYHRAGSSKSHILNSVSQLQFCLYSTFREGRLSGLGMVRLAPGGSTLGLGTDQPTGRKFCRWILPSPAGARPGRLFAKSISTGRAPVGPTRCGCPTDQ